MARVHAAFVGCKVSRADADAALARLTSCGHEAASAEEAEAIVVVTCCVTGEAERKSRRLVRRLGSGGRPVVVTGCAAAYRGEQFAAPGVTVLAAADAGSLPAQVLAAVETLLAPGEGAGDNGANAPGAGGAETAGSAAGPASARERTRLILKVQDGCSSSCTYCAVRLARGRLWSAPLVEALNAAREGVADGCGEVVLSGVNLGLYRDAAGNDLAALVNALVELPGLARLRLSSLEPQHLRPPLLDALAHPVVARHLHVPLQSADDGVLAAMARPYTFAEYLERLEAVRLAMGESMMSTDVIVGFPTEDEAAFSRTLAALRPTTGLFGRVHVFPFSARPGTAAASLSALPAPEVRRRAAAALALAAEALAAAAASELGRTVEVLAEDRVGALWRGYTSRYTRCYFKGNAQAGTLVRVAVDRRYKDGVQGRAV